MAVLIKPEGPLETFPMPLVGDRLKPVQEAVGGYIEVLKSSDGRYVLVDEDASVRRHPPPSNPRASMLVGFEILGNAVVVTHQEMMMWDAEAKS